MGRKTLMRADSRLFPGARFRQRRQETARAAVHQDVPFRRRDQMLCCNDTGYKQHRCGG